MLFFGLAIVGGAFCFTGVSLGFSFGDFRTVIEGSRPPFWNYSLLQNVSRGNITSGSSAEAEYEGLFSDVEELILETGAASCTMIPYDGTQWKVIGTNLSPGFTCEAEKGGTLEISCTGSKWRWWFWNWGGSAVESQITIYYPRDCELESVEISVGVGEFMMDGMLVCDELVLSCGVGSCQLGADIRDEGEIDCGVGDVILTLAGCEQDYNFDLDVGIGDIVIGGNATRSREIDNDADCDIEIECGVGSVEVIFV